MNYCRGSYSIICVFVITVYAVFSPQKVFAFESVSLAVPQFSQHLTVADANGDTGYYDCVMAVSAMALQAIYGTTDNFSDVSYASIRKKSRAVFPNVQKGINLRDGASLVPMLTNQEFDAAFVGVDQENWQEEVSRQLYAGYPLVAHINDWSYLWGHEGKTTAGHAILITGITETSVQYIDPWNGYRYSVPHAMFTEAWSQGDYSWHAMIFIPKGRASSAVNTML